MKAFKFAPCGDYVVVTRFKHEEKTASGLFLPEQVMTDENQCTVVATGPKVFDANIATGARVLVEKYDGRKVHVDGVDYIVLPEKEVLGVYNEKEV
jgi:chaperonin GroES